MTGLGKKFLSALYAAGGYYTALNKKGELVGRMIGYAGKYLDQEGNSLQYIGNVYANCSKLEEKITVLKGLILEALPALDQRLFNNCNLQDLFKAENVNNIVWCGAPMGGITTAMLLAEHSQLVNISEYSFLEKKVVELATGTSREKSKLVFGRHSIKSNDVVVPVEDVCNNFSTTQMMIEEFFKREGRVPFIFCLLNRSGRRFYSFESKEFGNRDIPILSLVSEDWPEYRQDDPRVSSYISVPGNLILDPKKNWDMLMNSMASYS